MSFNLTMNMPDILPHITTQEFNFISEAYFELYKTVLEKSRLTSLTVLLVYESRKNKIYNVETDQEEDYEENEINKVFEKQTLTLREYRQAAEPIFEICYNVLEKLKGNQGLDAIFSLVLPLLTPDYIANNNVDLNDSKMRKDYILSCEVVIFSVRPMVKSLIHSEPNAYVIEVLKRILELPKENILTRSSIELNIGSGSTVKFFSRDC